MHYINLHLLTYFTYLLVDGYLFKRCTYDISVCKIEILDPENVENEVLHDVFGHVVDEIWPVGSKRQPYWIFDSVMLTVTCKRSDDDKIHLFASSAK